MSKNIQTTFNLSLSVLGNLEVLQKYKIKKKIVQKSILKDFLQGVE